ncbi:hypothetical protein [Aquimarina sp. 2201CG5-10]|uniref:hypothetical protein n=1 Tax=Aquimarina callyspongiae TaxID=3098150 RepID=UPI002AB35D92|nr:hypothetical protein [Aquimarina sp. 2201CG5-10]MDY8138776.1 hypothetical protein [Aquimarina sp. 2201CG5-10]
MNRYIIYIFLMLSSFAFAQELPTITPPSPTAFELGKYGEVPVGMFTGTANVSIPLYQYKTRNLSVPISLSYNSNGLRVDQMTSWVGLGWSLNAGGVITRMVKDEDDDGAGAGLLTNSPDQEIQEMYTQGGNAVNPRVMDFYLNGIGAGIDSEYDIYNFNFQGASGRFILDRKNRVHILSDNPLLKITTDGFQANRTFSITAQNGVIYEFADTESSKILVPATSSYDPPRMTTSWYITRIIHPSGDEINFLYDQENQQYTQGTSETYSKLVNFGAGCAEGADCPPDNLSTSETVVSIYGLRLREINSNRPSAGKIRFQASTTHPDIPLALLSQVEILNESNTPIDEFSLNYDITSNSRVFLRDVTMKDPSQKYELSYMDKETFPSRLSKAQDYWGYYNGKDSNLHLVPQINNAFWQNFGGDRTPSATHAQKGLLQRITYPTKGSSEFIYGANVVSSAENTYVNANQLIGTGNLYPNSTTFTVPNNYHNSFANPTKLVTNLDLDSFGCTSCTGTAVVSIFDVTDNQELLSRSISRNDHLNEDVTLLKNHTYTISISRNGTLDYIADIRYYLQEEQVQDVVYAGQRIEEVRNLDNNNQITNRKYYKYEAFNTGVSSGQRGIPVDFEDDSVTRLNCSNDIGNGTPLGAYVDCQYRTLFSSTTNSVLSQRSSSVYYKYVTISEGDANYSNGAEEHEFIINRNTTSQLLWGSGQFAPFELLNADAANNGFPKRVTLYTKKGTNTYVKQQETINNYLKDDSYTNVVNSYIIKKIFDPIIPGESDYNCEASDINKRYSYYNCTTSHTHHWHIDNGYECIAPGNNNVLLYRNHSCYGQPLNSVIRYQNLLDRGLDYYLYVVRNQNVSERYYMDTTVSMVFDSNGENPITTTTKYHYDNTFHRLPTRTEVTDSEGSQMLTKTYYPDDVTNVSSLPGGNLSQQEYNAINDLKRVYQNQSATPIQVESYKKEGSQEILLSRQRTLFKDWGSNLILPEIVQLGKSNDALQDRVEYLDYDNHGNALEVSKADGSHISYIWGYNQEYPIAKVENATRSEIEALSGFGANFHTGTTGLTSTQENSLRTDLPNAMVTTYTYDPLIGVTSITDPRGYTIYYQYDQFNRLQYVKDAEGNLVSENQYNYKN